MNHVISDLNSDQYKDFFFSSETTTLYKTEKFPKANRTPQCILTPYTLWPFSHQNSILRYLSGNPSLLCNEFDSNKIDPCLMMRECKMLNIASWGAERQVLMGEKTVLCGESHVTRLSMDAIQSYDTELRLSPFSIGHQRDQKSLKYLYLH